MGTVKGMQAHFAEHRPAGLQFAQSIFSLAGLLRAARGAHTISAGPVLHRDLPLCDSPVAGQVLGES